MGPREISREEFGLLASPALSLRISQGSIQSELCSPGCSASTVGAAVSLQIPALRLLFQGLLSSPGLNLVLHKFIWDMRSQLTSWELFNNFQRMKVVLKTRQSCIAHWFIE